MMTIGFLGSHVGVGVTHTSILLSSYLREFQSKKIALVEIGNRSSYVVIKKESKFSLYGVDYYPNASKIEVLSILSKDYSFVIMDFGSEKKNLNEFFRCDMKFVVGSLCKWKQHYLMNLILDDMVRDYKKQIKILITLSDKRYERKLDKIKMYFVPYLCNPWSISTESILLFNQFFFGGE